MKLLGIGLILLAGILPARAELSVEKDILPFGWPAGVGDLSSTGGAVLSKAELANCITWYLELERTDAEGRVGRAELMAYQAGAALENSRKKPAGEPVDEVDRQLDTIEMTLKAQDPGLEQRVVDYLRKRQEYFHRVSEFSAACGTKTYRLEDLRSLASK